MFERSYLWTMRHGSRLLFTIALAVLAATWILSAIGLGGGGAPFGLESSQSPASWLLTWIMPFVNSLQIAVWPLFGSLVIDRLDRDRRDPK